MDGTGNNSPPPPYSAPVLSSSGTLFETKVPPNLTSDYPPVPQFNIGVLPVYVPNNTPANITIQPSAPTTSRISARTALFGPFPVEMDCLYCQVSFV